MGQPAMASFRNPQLGLIGAIATICWTFLFPSDVIADEVPGDDPFCVEQPGQTTPPCVVKPRTVMIETGIATQRYSKAGNDRLNEAAASATTVRYGVAPQLELQFGWAGLVSSSRTASDMRVQSSRQGHAEHSASISAEGGVRLIGNTLHWAKLFGPHFYFANRGLA